MVLTSDKYGGGKGQEEGPHVKGAQAHHGLMSHPPKAAALCSRWPHEEVNGRTQSGNPLQEGH